MVAIELEPQKHPLLIADDSDSSRFALRDVLQPRGFQTYLAGSGREAVEIVQNHSIHLVLMDIEMPGLTGLEAWELMKALLRRCPPCIFMTAHPSKEIKLKALSADAATILSKPLSPQVVWFAVEHFLRRFYY